MSRRRSTQPTTTEQILQRFTIISGCSGGGKSTLLGELQRRGYSVIDEPGRRIVASEMACGGNALPWSDPKAFLEKAVEMSLADLERATALPGHVFFDRGLFDAASALEALTDEPWLARLDPRSRFDKLVFVTPPWPEIYETDAERQHGLDQAIGEYHRLRVDYPAHGFEVAELPKTATSARADFVLSRLGLL